MSLDAQYFQQVLTSMMTPLCIKRNEAVFVCQNSTCHRQNPFVCSSSDCQCQKYLHKDCSLISWKKFSNQLNFPDKYRNQFTDIVKELENMIKDSEKNNDLLKQQIIKCKTFLAKNQDNRLHIIKFVQEKEFGQITKSQIQEYLQFNRISNQQSKLKEMIAKNVRIIQENSTQIHRFFNKIYESDLNLINSKIIDSIEDVSKFFNQKVKQLKLLYRASDRGFSIERFHKLCDNIPNTIIIVKTQFNVVFGGFSPQPWNGVGAKQDPTEQSFLFSLTHDEKMEIINSKFAIFNCPKVGPIFGGGNSIMADIEICDKANEVKKSGSNFPINYNNSKKYTPGQASIYHLTGQSKDRYFFIKQWEVFSVLFCNETEGSVVESSSI